jgi:cytochrome c oxidase cbb3-type subunit 3
MKMTMKENIAMSEHQEKDRLLDHNFDGIQELDNDLPPWWVYLFYLTIIFSIGYFLMYHILGEWPLQEAEYQNELQAAAELKAELAAANPAPVVLAPLTDAAALDNGKNIWIERCAQCHLDDGGGSIGPNMTDNYWIHGNDYATFIRIVNDGILDKGMLAWKGILTPQEINEVTSYMVTLQGTTPKTPKAPQGELVE